MISNNDLSPTDDVAGMNGYFGLIRHAPTAWNLEKRIQGRMDIPLDPKGVGEAEDLAESLENQGFHRIIASPLARAAHTARIISGRLGLALDLENGFIEADFGIWQGRTFKEIIREDPEALDVKKVEGWQFRPPGGESRLEVFSRARKALVGTASRFPNERILVVTHKTLIKTLIYRTMGWEFKSRSKERIGSGGLHLLAPDLSWARPDQALPLTVPNVFSDTPSQATLQEFDQCCS